MTKNMGTNLTTSEDGGGVAGYEEYVTMFTDGQMFGIPVLLVQDVLGPQKITKIPLSPPEVAGALILRGRIVTAIDVRRRLGLDDLPPDNPGMCIVVEHGADLYSLIVDSVGEVLSLPGDQFEPAPSTLNPAWAKVCKGIYRLDEHLMLVLDVSEFIDFESSMAA